MALTLVIYNAGVLLLTHGMKYIIVWTLQRGALNPPEQLTDEEAQTVDHHEQVPCRISQRAYAMVETL